MSEFDAESESEFDIDYMSGNVSPLEIDFIESDRTPCFRKYTYL